MTPPLVKGGQGRSERDEFMDPRLYLKQCLLCEKTIDGRTDAFHASSSYCEQCQEFLSTGIRGGQGRTAQELHTAAAVMSACAMIAVLVAVLLLVFGRWAL